MKNRNQIVIQAAYQAGRAAVVHALVNGLLATQCLSDVEVLAFFKTVRRALEEEVKNSGRIQFALWDAGIEESASTPAVRAYVDAIELQLRLVEAEITETIDETRDRRA